MRLSGKEVHYSFKFNMVNKKAESAKILTQIRDDRLRDVLADQEKP